ncbi:MAG: GTPase [Pirellulales bacterium]
MWSADELIVAPATVPGRGARAIVRLTGDGLASLLEAMFTLRATSWPQPGEPPRVVPATLAADGLGRDWGDLAVDLLVWPGPAGPVGAPLAEVQLPASAHLVDAVVAEACRHGARLARGGEFTLRAFLAGRVDLVQAEAVLGVVDARTPDELCAALDRMAGGAGRALAAVRDELLDLLADIEASIDFADETAPDSVPVAPAWSEVARRLDGCRRSIEQVSATLAARDAAASDLPRVALVGPPNIGKSSLFNSLAGRDAAIVADEPGTTRDWLEARIGGRAGADHVLVDLAGLDAASGIDGVAAAAQAAAVAELRRADVIVVCRDAITPAATPVDHAGIRIDVVTRCDLGGAPASDAIATSVRTGAGIDSLHAAIRAAVATLPARGSPATVRMAVGATAAATAVATAAALARAAVTGAASDEAEVAASLRTAVESLAEVTGSAIGTDLLDRIFSRHCIGK